HYRADNLPAGDYRLSIHAPGFKADPKSGIALTADQSLAQDFALQKSFVRWNEISQWQGHELLPNDRGKDALFSHCFACHGFQTRMASVKRDEDGWRARVEYMRQAMGFFIMRPQNNFTDQKFEDVVYYINHVFGEDSVLPKSPAELPNYQS